MRLCAPAVAACRQCTPPFPPPHLQTHTHTHTHRLICTFLPKQAAHQLRRLLQSPPDVQQLILSFVTSEDAAVDSEEAYGRLLALEQVRLPPRAQCARAFSTDAVRSNATSLCRPRWLSTPLLLPSSFFWSRPHKDAS